MNNYVCSAACRLKPGMETNDARRKRKLAKLSKEKNGVRSVAEAAGLRWESLDQVLKGTLLPEKANGKREARGLGDPAARAIESAYGLGEGWFDWPFDFVDARRYDAITDEQKIFVQARMVQAIEECEKPQPLVKRGKNQPLVFSQAPGKRSSSRRRA